MNNSTIIGKKIFNFIENRQDLTHLGDLETWLIDILPQLSTSPQQLRKSLSDNDLRLRRGGELHGKIKWRSEDSNGILENITISLRHIIFTILQKLCNMIRVPLQRKK